MILKARVLYHTQLWGASDVILGRGMIVIFSVDYVDILIFSIHFTSCMYVLLFLSKSDFKLW